MTGTANGLLAVTWLTEGMNLLTSAPGATSGAFGLGRLGAGVLLIGSAAITAVSKPLIAAVVALAAIRSVLSAL